ncbi:hypothetical protein BV898_03164 [Hypsibius exemplaris]|uniref:Uncharacterized protein n=1 Tax=Hypsibius exemplaris TaxID=2072580 RepID=A0A1W0X5R8_HYPEX|nr:hypothetical protein BV898_03164 [Hypsibius exemplaris]
MLKLMTLFYCFLAVYPLPETWAQLRYGCNDHFYAFPNENCSYAGVNIDRRPGFDTVNNDGTINSIGNYDPLNGNSVNSINNGLTDFNSVNNIFNQPQNIGNSLNNPLYRCNGVLYAFAHSDCTYPSIRK